MILDWGYGKVCSKTVILVKWFRPEAIASTGAAKPPRYQPRGNKPADGDQSILRAYAADAEPV